MTLCDSSYPWVLLHHLDAIKYMYWNSGFSYNVPVSTFLLLDGKYRLKIKVIRITFLHKNWRLALQEACSTIKHFTIQILHLPSLQNLFIKVRTSNSLHIHCRLQIRELEVPLAFFFRSLCTLEIWNLVPKVSVGTLPCLRENPPTNAIEQELAATVYLNRVLSMRN